MISSRLVVGGVLLLVSGRIALEVQATPTGSTASVSRSSYSTFLLTGKRKYDGYHTGSITAVEHPGIHNDLAFRRGYFSLFDINRGGGGGGEGTTEPTHDDDDDDDGDDEDHENERDDVNDRDAIHDENHDDSANNIDRMDYADAYDEDVEEEEGGDGTWTTETKDGTVTVNGDDDDDDDDDDDHDDDQNNNDGVVVATDSGKKIALRTEITPAMKDALVRTLKYRRREVERMRPEIATMIVAKRLARPPEGVPPHWLLGAKDGHPNDGTATRLRMKSIIVSFLTIVATIVGGTAVASYTDGGISRPHWMTSGGTRTTTTTPPPPPPPLPGTLYEVPAPIIPEPENTPAKSEEKEETMSKVDKKKKKDTPTPSTEQSLLGSSTTTKTTSTTTSHHEHSVRPGERPPQQPIDETILDKVLTKMEKAIGNLFR